MQVLESAEDYGGPEDGYAFAKTIVVYEEDGEIYRAFSRKQYASTADIRYADLYSSNKIRCALYPQFDDSFTKAEGSAEYLSTLYLKTPSLTTYTPRKPNLIRDAWLREVKTWELLRKYPHPNIAKYHGCFVSETGAIEAIYLTTYDQTLAQKVNPSHLAKGEFVYEKLETEKSTVDEWFRGIESGLRHLHTLGIVHNDINPNNIMFEGETPVIIDFDSARPLGYSLDWVKMTYGWYNHETKLSLPTNDLDALHEMKLWLAGAADQFQF
ncbi:unnamed protein product [Penicillium olsonii]|uniref:Protein kinase domain-containing protein n=1 Tax=Penicillium olsonii TaxID=99116 RepID=A0A9W4N280_PENOL|nr:unnamed protein product [Penicillium olsonii]CAG8156433.1 unnamed protein product [Penicillium olsonii]CAG8238721.1 unnamed protein product [Penicillium olsonii]